MIRRTRVEVDLAAVVENARTVRRIANTDVVAVVKADAYGHGAVAVARALERAKAASGFAVSLVEEGVTLRDAGITTFHVVVGYQADLIDRTADELDIGLRVTRVVPAS